MGPLLQLLFGGVQEDADEALDEDDDDAEDEEDEDELEAVGDDAVGSGSGGDDEVDDDGGGVAVALIIGVIWSVGAAMGVVLPMAMAGPGDATDGEEPVDVTVVVVAAADAAVAASIPADEPSSDVDSRNSVATCILATTTPVTSFIQGIASPSYVNLDLLLMATSSLNNRSSNCPSCSSFHININSKRLYLYGSL